MIGCCSCRLYPCPLPTHICLPLVPFPIAVPPSSLCGLAPCVAWWRWVQHLRRCLACCALVVPVQGPCLPLPALGLPACTSLPSPFSPCPFPTLPCSSLPPYLPLFRRRRRERGEGDKRGLYISIYIYISISLYTGSGLFLSSSLISSSDRRRSRIRRDGTGTGRDGTEGEERGGERGGNGLEPTPLFAHLPACLPHTKPSMCRLHGRHGSGQSG